MSLRLNGSTSGYVEIDAPAVAGTTSITIPATAGELAVKATDGSVDLGGVNVDASGRLLVGTSNGSGGYAVSLDPGTTGSPLVRDSLGNVKIGPAGSEKIILKADGSGIQVSEWSMFAAAANPATGLIVNGAQKIAGISNGNTADPISIDAVSNGRIVVHQSNRSNPTIAFVGSGTIQAVNTTVQPIASERRLKENINPIDKASAWQTVRDTPFYSYNFIGSKLVSYGPIVDELPADIILETDRFDDQGVIHTYDNGLLQARLFVALQEAMERIETLEAEVQALKGGN